MVRRKTSRRQTAGYSRVQATRTMLEIPKETHAKQTETRKDPGVEFGLTCVKSFSLYFASKTGSTGMSAGKPSTQTGV